MPFIVVLVSMGALLDSFPRDLFFTSIMSTVVIRTLTMCSLCTRLIAMHARVYICFRIWWLRFHVSSYNIPSHIHHKTEIFMKDYISKLIAHTLTLCPRIYFTTSPLIILQLDFCLVISYFRSPAKKKSQFRWAKD